MKRIFLVLVLSLFFTSNAGVIDERQCIYMKETGDGTNTG